MSMAKKGMVKAKVAAGRGGGGPHARGRGGSRGKDGAA